LQKNSKQFQNFVTNLGEVLSYNQVDNLVIMTTSLIATALLMHRRGLNIDLLHKRVCFIYDEIIARNGLVQVNIKPTKKIVQTCSAYLSDFVA
jgi:hypothetical protein